MSMIGETIDGLKILHQLLSLVDQPHAKKDMQTIEDAIEIIQELSTKLQAANMERSSQYYNGGWIPCCERMPLERPSIFAKLKGTSKWDRGMFLSCSDEVITTIQHKGEVDAVIAHTIDGKWKCDFIMLYPEARVIAWMPLPEPYRE